MIEKFLAIKKPDDGHKLTKANILSLWELMTDVRITVLLVMECGYRVTKCENVLDE